MKEKIVTCEHCYHTFKVELVKNRNEYKDGWHGECPRSFCGYWYFESLER